MNKKQQTQLKKVFNLAINPGTEAEGAVAKSKIVELCEKFQINLDDFIEGASNKLDMIVDFAPGYEQRAFDAEFKRRADESTKAANNRATEAEDSKADATEASQAKDKKPSRRSLIIAAINEGTHTAKQFAHTLQGLGYPDYKKNKKAIAGTIWDLQTHKGIDIRTDAKTSIISVKA
jgi:hypothetical protein